MDIVILIIICIGLIIHRHLSTYWEAGNLPFAHGFVLFVWIFSIINLVNFIWLFGFIVGLILTLLTLFQITFATFLWPFLVPGLIRDNRKSDFDFMLTKNEPSKLLYGGWTFLIIGLSILTIANFFVGSYSSLTDNILEAVNGNYSEAIMYAVIAIIGGNLLRIITIKLLSR